MKRRLWKPDQSQRNACRWVGPSFLGKTLWNGNVSVVDKILSCPFSDKVVEEDPTPAWL